MRLTEQTQRLTQRGEQIAAELAEIADQAEAETQQREEAAANLARLNDEIGGHALELEAALERFRQVQVALDAQRETVRLADRELQEAVFQGKTSLGKISEVERAIAAASESLERAAQALASEQEALGRLDESPWQSQLQIALSLRGTKEQALAQARDVLEATESQLKAVEQERMTAEQKLGPLRDRINEIRLKEQEARLSEEQYAQQLVEAAANEEALALAVEKGMRSGSLQSEINRLNEEIKSLGAVNLAALEELEAGRERKAYLDAQSADLTAAMNTLEDAIRRIDRETRERLQSTFDEVNAHFSKMFPALFGGGNARLVLTGEEILDAGIQVIAQPPGKKNSSIHLLSGGEKALTAMSLVFSIFQLNPAPFCMLDEVDAPLDDHNTSRFCELVKKMSEQSQFVFISHNKITMEIANQLLGITMQEPGVSRVVAVDIEAAMKLTEEAVPERPDKMSDLQIALAALGAVVIAAPSMRYNAWQERKLQHRLERAFDGQREDVLLKTTEPLAPRIEPRLGDAAESAAAPTGTMSGRRAAEQVAVNAEGADALIEFIATVEAGRIRSTKPQCASCRA